MNNRKFINKVESLLLSYWNGERKLWKAFWIMGFVFQQSDETMKAAVQELTIATLCYNSIDQFMHDYNEKPQPEKAFVADTPDLNEALLKKRGIALTLETAQEKIKDIDVLNLAKNAVMSALNGTGVGIFPLGPKS